MTTKRLIPTSFLDNGRVRSHRLNDKTVHWQTLSRVPGGKASDFFRSSHNGKVLAVSVDGTVALVNRLPYNDMVEVEIADLTF